MAINLFAFLISRAIAQGRGLPATEVNRLGLVGAILKPPVLGIILASAIANSEAPPGGGATTGKALSATGMALFGGTSVPVIAAGPTPPVPPGMISFHGMDKTQAEKYASWLGLNPPRSE